MNNWTDKKTNYKKAALSKTSLLVLMCLKDIKQWSKRQEDLADLLGLELIQLQRALRNLDKAGFIDREKITKKGYGDGRLTRVKITKEGAINA